MSIITSRCGSVTLMGLGLMLVGLATAGLSVGVGQVWLEHARLQDALDNAALVMRASRNASASTLLQLVDANSGLNTVRLVAFSDHNDALKASISAPARLWFWATWMGSSPDQITATTV